MARAKSTTIRCGSSREKGKMYVGMTVGKIRKALKDALNIPKGAKSYINGESANAKTVLKEGQTLEFIKPAGRHG